MYSRVELMHWSPANPNSRPLPSSEDSGIQPRAAPPLEGETRIAPVTLVRSAAQRLPSPLVSGPVSEERTEGISRPQSSVSLKIQEQTPWKWSVGVTTAPRELPTLERTLHSLANAGWESPHLFAEPDCVVPDGFPVTRRGIRLGAWPNWYLALSELVLKDPLADAYFLIQDDVLFSRNCRAFLEGTLWPSGRLGVVSLYCPSIYHADKGLHNLGPHDVTEGFGLVGALTFIFTPEAARAILLDTSVADHRLKGRRKGLCNIDAVVGRWALENERRVCYYAPSLAAHIGATSSIWPNQEPRFSRTSQSFLGEQFDARELLP